MSFVKLAGAFTGLAVLMLLMVACAGEISQDPAAPPTQESPVALLGP